MSLSSPEGNEKPLLFFLAFPGHGHVGPLLTIASYMVKRGYDVAFMCSESFKDTIINAGVEFLEMPEPFGPDYPNLSPELLSLPPGLERLAGQLNHVFFRKLPIRAQAAMEALEALHKRDPERQIIIVEDVLNMGTLPLKYGRPLPEGINRVPKRIGISPIPLFVESQDTAPMMLGLPPDSTESGRLRNQVLHLLYNGGPMGSVFETRDKALSASQCTITPEDSPWSAWFTNSDVTFMLCSPSLEYPLSDMPSTIHFAGCLPRREHSTFEYPDWWSEILGDTAVKGRKKNIVFVSQGTVNFDRQELIAPTLKAFVGRDDILVIATLGSWGAKAPEDIEIPENARVIDYIPYDLILEHTDVFISNGGYGALQHAVMNGVPTVFAGQTEEKPEVIMRGEFAGFALSLRTRVPTPEQVREGVDKVLGDPNYKKRAMELRKENEEMDSLKGIEQKIVELTE